MNKKALPYHRKPTNNKYSRNYASTKLPLGYHQNNNSEKNTNDVMFYERTCGEEWDMVSKYAAIKYLFITKEEK